MSHLPTLLTNVLADTRFVLVYSDKILNTLAVIATMTTFIFYTNKLTKSISWIFRKSLSAVKNEPKQIWHIFKDNYTVALA